MIIQTKFNVSKEKAVSILAYDLQQGHCPPGTVKKLKEILRWYLMQYGNDLNFQEPDESMRCRAQLVVDKLWSI